MLEGLKLLTLRQYFSLLFFMPYREVCLHISKTRLQINSHGSATLLKPDIAVTFAGWYAGSDGILNRPLGTSVNEGSLGTISSPCTGQKSKITEQFVVGASNVVFIRLKDAFDAPCAKIDLRTEPESLEGANILSCNHSGYSVGQIIETSDHKTHVGKPFSLIRDLTMTFNPSAYSGAGVFSQEGKLLTVKGSKRYSFDPRYSVAASVPAFRQSLERLGLGG